MQSFRKIPSLYSSIIGLWFSQLYIITLVEYLLNIQQGLGCFQVKFALTMRFTIQLVVVFTAMLFGFINAGPVPDAKANAEPHNFFKSRYGAGYATPHFASLGHWKRDTPAQAAEVQKRQDGYGPGYGCEFSLYTNQNINRF